MTGCPDGPRRSRAAAAAVVALVAALLLGGPGFVWSAADAALVGEVETTEQSPRVAIDTHRVRTAASRRASPAVMWWSRRARRGPRPLHTATRRALPRFHRRGSPPRRGPPFIE